MDNKIPTGRKFSQNKTGQELFKGSDTLLAIQDENINSNNQLPQKGKDINFLSVYYNKKAGNGNFLEKITKLNKRFYNCSDRFVKSKKALEKLNDELYLNLFQQINYYVEEIERLNKKLSVNNNQDYKKTIDLLNKDISEKKEKIRHLENKIREKTLNEEKLNKEIDSNKRKIIFYKDKIKIALLARNRNSLKSLGRETSSSILMRRKKSAKNPTKYHSPSPEKKNKSFVNKKKIYNKDLKLDEENINKGNIDKEKENNNNEEKSKKIKKIYKPKESVYVNYFNNKTDYDIDEKEREEKDDEYNLNLNIKSSDNQINSVNELSSDNINKNTSVFINALTQELYGSPVQDINNSIDNESNSDLNSKKINSAILSEKKNEIEEDEKCKTLNRNEKYKRKVNKPKTTKQNENKNDNIKSKIFKSSNDRNKSDVSNKNETETNSNNINKTKQAKTTAKSKSKNPIKSIDKTSKAPGVETPYVKKKYINYNEKDVSKNIVPDTNIKNAPHTPNVVHQKRGSAVNRNVENKIKISLNNAPSESTNNLSKTYKKAENDSLKNHGFYSTSNLNVVSGKEKYNNISYKRLSDKQNKELHSVLMNVDDDYLRSIEILRKQEDQIMRLLKDIDLDD
jgi:hypothetical protein